MIYFKLFAANDAEKYIFEYLSISTSTTIRKA